MSKHVLVKAQAICETPFFIESIDETTRSAYRDIDCAACLRQALAAAEQRTHVIRELLAKAEVSDPERVAVRCRIYDVACINPIYCDARDACCAGDPDCVPPSDREEGAS